MNEPPKRPDLTYCCPRCGGTSYRIDPTFDEDEAPTSVVAVVCARCDYHYVDTTVAEAVARWHVLAPTAAR